MSRSRFNRRGQTLVELAFLFPLIIFAFLIFAQLLRLVITEVWIHQSANQLAQRIAVGASAAALDLELAADYLHLRKSAYPDPLSSGVSQSETIQGWKPYPGIKTFDRAPHLVRTKITFRLFQSAWFTWLVPGSALSAQAESPGDITIE